MLMAERFLPLLLLLRSSNQAFLACLNKACLPGRGWIPLWPFALWPKVHSICKVRNSSEVQLMGLSFFHLLDSAPALGRWKMWKTSSMYRFTGGCWEFTWSLLFVGGGEIKIERKQYPAAADPNMEASTNLPDNPVGSWPIDLMGDVVEWKCEGLRKWSLISSSVGCCLGWWTEMAALISIK